MSDPIPGDDVVDFERRMSLLGASASGIAKRVHLDTDDFLRLLTLYREVKAENERLSIDCDANQRLGAKEAMRADEAEARVKALADVLEPACEAVKASDACDNEDDLLHVPAINLSVEAIRQAALLLKGK